MRSLTHELANELNAMGIPANITQEPTDEQDGRIDLGEFPGLYLQVGDSYADLAYYSEDVELNMMIGDFKIQNARTLIDNAIDLVMKESA